MAMAARMNRLFQYYRILATGFCFGLFGLGGLVLSFVIIPLIRLTTPDQIQREYRVQRVIQATFNFFCKLMRCTRD